MEIKITYIGINGNGAKGIWCGFKPNNSIILEEKQILYAETGKVLQHKESKKEYYSVILNNDDSPENYTEIEERKLNDLIK